MHIYVDADACPVKEIIERVAKENSIPVTMVIDVNHILMSDYSEIAVVSQGADSADLYLINRVQKGDIVVSQDYGVASLALGKGAKAVSNSGLVFTNDNIDKLLFERFLGKKIRKAPKGKRTMPHNRKRTQDDDFEFEKSLRELIK
ncbi:MAG: YaiI/YqxD family protein [Clostridia bacterium]|nr:YaiI/YqxD family protein [Clostridia bacterium]